MHEISNYLICATSKGSDQPAHTCSLIRAFACRLNILQVLSYWPTSFGVSKLKRRLQRLVRVYTCQNASLLEITCLGSLISFQLTMPLLCSESLHFGEKLTTCWGLLYIVCFRRKNSDIASVVGPRRDKTCLRGFRQREIQTSLLSYRD